MTRRMKQALLAVAALGALALGGSAMAQAGTTTVKPALEPTSGPDRDKIQSGDQTTPDQPAAAKASKATKNVSTTTKAKSAASEAPGVETAPNSDGPSGPAQETTGTSSAPAESPAASETPGAGETPSSETPSANDGPGGHADEPGNPNADHQFNGQE